jgi:ABC-type nitrate/sulfonate/bicarbonate transport system substrate-binding protein
MKIQNWCKWVTTASLAAILVLNASCSRQAAPASVAKAPAPQKVRFGISAFQDTLLPIIGADQYKGWYKEMGLDVEFHVLGWTELQEALAAGSIDVAINNCSAVVATHNRLPDLVYWYGINTFDNGFALMVRPNSGLKTVDELAKTLPNRAAAVEAAARQLKGKTVVTTRNTDMEQGVAAFARRGGLKFSRGNDSDVRISDMAPEDGLTAFLVGEGDAYIGGIPQRTRAGKEGMVELVSGLDLGPAPINGLVTTKKFATDHEAELVKILHVWFRIVNYVEQDREAGAGIIIKELNSRSGAKFTLTDFNRFWQQYERYPLSAAAAEKDILAPGGRNYWKARWDDCNNYFYSTVHTITEPVDPEAAFWMPRAQAAYVKAFGSEPVKP